MRTAFCDRFGIAHPVALAGMGGGTNAELVAAVSQAGGLGILACTWATPEAAEAAIAEIRRRTDRPFGVNFVLHYDIEPVFQACLAARVPVFSFFRGQPAAATARAQAAGARVLHQVTTLAEAAEALAAGVDALVAQGAEAGGHGGALPLWSFLPEVVALAGTRPVLAAGGIVEGRGLAAALCFGAAGVLMGTRFLATPESPLAPAQKAALLAAGLGETVASVAWDHVWDAPWPGGIRTRSLWDELTRRFAGREDDMLAELGTLRADHARAEAAGDFARLPNLAGEGVGRIRALMPAAEVVRQTVAEAEAVLRALPRTLGI